MKKNMILVFALNFCIASNAQITIPNTTWKLHIISPREVDLEFSFSADTLSVTAEGIGLIGLSLFSQHHDSLIVKKISGGSSCAVGIEALYRIEWLENGEKFLLRTINDDCVERSQVYTSGIFERIRHANDIPRNWSYKNLKRDSVFKIIILETVHRPHLMVYRPGSQIMVPFKSLSITGGILDAEAAMRKAIELTKK